MDNRFTQVLVAIVTGYFKPLVLRPAECTFGWGLGCVAYLTWSGAFSLCKHWSGVQEGKANCINTS